MIFRNIIFSAILVGIVSGLIYGLFQQFQLSPIIYAAEQFEVTAPVNAHEQHSGHQHNKKTWAPEEGTERVFWTMLANVLTAISFALLMLSLMALHDLKAHKPKLDALRGIGWGIAGMLSLFVAPALLGLHPEVPGTLAAALDYRQAWWLVSVLVTALAAALLYYAPLKFKVFGLVVAVIPYLIFAPVDVPYHFTNNEPMAVAVLTELTQQFYSMTAIGMALFFIILGAGSGFAVKKFINLEPQAT